jgi:hypothetical protein
MVPKTPNTPYYHRPSGGMAGEAEAYIQDVVPRLAVKQQRRQHRDHLLPRRAALRARSTERGVQRGQRGELPGLGFGRIVVSEIKVPIILVNMV